MTPQKKPVTLLGFLRCWHREPSYAHCKSTVRGEECAHSEIWPIRKNPVQREGGAWLLFGLGRGFALIVCTLQLCSCLSFGTDVYVSSPDRDSANEIEASRSLAGVRAKMQTFLRQGPPAAKKKADDALVALSQTLHEPRPTDSGCYCGDVSAPAQ